MAVTAHGIPAKHSAQQGRRQPLSSHLACRPPERPACSLRRGDDNHTATGISQNVANSRSTRIVLTMRSLSAISLLLRAIFFLKGMPPNLFGFLQLCPANCILMPRASSMPLAERRFNSAELNAFVTLTRVGGSPLELRNGISRRICDARALTSASWRSSNAPPLLAWPRAIRMVL